MLKKLTDELAQIKKFDSIDLLKTYGITIDTYSNSNSQASEEEENESVSDNDSNNESNVPKSRYSYTNKQIVLTNSL